MTPEQFDQRQHDLSVAVKVLGAFISRKANTDRDGKVHEWYRVTMPDGTVEETADVSHGVERLMAEVLRRIEL
jgi:hypothetical protein